MLQKLISFICCRDFCRLWKLETAITKLICTCMLWFNFILALNFMLHCFKLTMVQSFSYPNTTYTCILGYYSVARKNQTSIRNSTTSRSWRLWFVWAFLQCIWIWQQSAHTYMYSRFGKSSQLLGIQSMLFSVRILQITTLKISHTCIYNNTNRLTCGAQKFKIIKIQNNKSYILGQKVLRILHCLTHRTPTLRIWHHGDPFPHPSLVNVV